jgi:hypothetical protein
MLQVRNPSQGERRWFNPERDMVWAFPRVISAALKSFYENDPPRTTEEMSVAFKRLASLCNQCRDGALDKEALIAELKVLDPAILQAVSKAFFFAWFGEFHGWCADIRPKDAQEDIPLDLRKLEAAVELFARSAKE